MASTKPDISKVTHWDLIFISDDVRVDMATVPYEGFDAEIWRVTPGKGTGVRKKTFFGESAWMDARRYASDIDGEAWSMHY